MEKITKTKKKELNTKQIIFLGDLGVGLTVTPQEVAIQNAKVSTSPKTVYNGLSAVLRRTQTEGGIEHGSIRKKLGKFGGVLTAMESVVSSKLDDPHEEQRVLLDKAKIWLERDGKRKDGRQQEVVRQRKRLICETIVQQSDLERRVRTLQQYNTDLQELEKKGINISKLSELKEEKRREGDKLSAEGRQLQAGLTLAFGSTKKPGAGNSDSFLIKDGKGVPRFMFKPMEGEPNMTGTDWPQGGGAPREVMFSALNDTIKNTLHVDLGVTRTTPCTLTSDEFLKGQRVKNPKCTGAIQDAIVFDEDGALKCKPGMHDNALEFNAPTPDEIKEWKASVSVEDIQKVALLDFLTLNLDRNATNVLIKHEPNPKGGGIVRRLIPIDAGNALPPRSVFTKRCGTMSLTEPVVDPTKPIEESSNLLNQLEGAHKPLTKEMVKSIGLLDPEAIGRSLQQANDSMPQEMQGKVAKESIEMAKASAAFLKTVVTLDKNISVAEISYLYAHVFAGYLDQALPNNQSVFKDSGNLQQYVAETVPQARLRFRQDVETAQAKKQYIKLGGMNALERLGYEEKDYPDFDERVKLLQAGTVNPQAVIELGQVLNQAGLDENTVQGHVPGYDKYLLVQKIKSVRDLIRKRAELENLLNTLTLTDGALEDLLGEEYRGKNATQKVMVATKYKKLKEELAKLDKTDEQMGQLLGNAYVGKKVDDKMSAISKYKKTLTN